MTLREACILTIWTGYILCEPEDLDKFLIDEGVPDPHKADSFEDVVQIWDQLRCLYSEEVKEIRRNIERP